MSTETTSNSTNSIIRNKHAPLYARKDDEERGRYLVAARSIPKGRLIFCERPLVALQSLGNPVWACHNCKAFVGGPYAALRILTTHSMPEFEEEINNEEGDHDSCWKVIPCRYRCGQVYCSEECEADFWEYRHQYLCTGRIAPSDNEASNTNTEHPLIQFKQHAVATNEIFLLVAEWMVAEYSYHKKANDNMHIKVDDNFMVSSPFEDFLMEPWWDIDSNEEGDNDENENTREILKNLCAEACDFWKQHWKQMSKNDDPAMDSTSLHIANIIGACELNAIGIRRRNPLCREIASSEFRHKMRKEVLSCLKEAGMLQSPGEEEEEEGDSGTTHQNRDDENESNEEKWTYSDDDLAEFLAGLDIYEEERTEKDEGETANPPTELPSVEVDVEENQASDDDSDQVDQCCNDDRDDFDVLFPAFDGTAMYAKCCKMNHSCDPNVVVLYKTRGWGAKHPLVAYCIATQRIFEGEELSISYINSDDPVETRQEALQHYGFACSCSKCQREMAEAGSEPVPETRNGQVAPAGKDEDCLFESDDSDSDDGGDGENIGSSSQVEDARENEAADGEAALAQTFGWLDTVLNNAPLGSIPLPYLAQASAYVIQTATAAQTGVSDNVTVSKLLESCVYSMRERDFVLAETVGKDLEHVLFSMLKKESKWPSVSYREAFWSAIITAAVGLAHKCSFLSAISYLDKAIILGLDRNVMDDFICYVEQYAAQMAVGPCPPVIAHDCIPDYTMAEYRDMIRNTGLSQPIRFPMKEYVRPDEGEIHLLYISRSKPVIIREHASTWPAIQKWRNLAFFCRYFGHRLVPIELGSMKSESGMKEEIMSVRHFMSSYLAQSAAKECWTLKDAGSLQHNVAYLAQHPLIKQLPELGSDIDLKPSLCGPLGPSHVYLWIGTGGTRTPLHFDSYSNLFVQLVGVKYVRIYGVEETSKLYVSKNESYGLQGNMCDIDCEQEDFSVHPLAKDAIYQEVVLFPGDALYIPARAWHYVRSLSTSMSVNFWF